MNLELRAKRNAVVHVSPEPRPLCQLLDGAFLSCEDASCLLQLLLVSLQIADALSLQQVQLLLPALVHGDVLAHVRVEAEIRVGREEGVQHGVNLWREEREVNVRSITNTQLTF